MMKTVTMKLENANAELRVGDSNGVVIINNNNLVSIDELKEILSMFNYLNNSATETKIKKDATNF
jgi:pilus assembly protein TadC